MAKAPTIPVVVGDPEYGPFRCRACGGDFTPEQWATAKRGFWPFVRPRHRTCPTVFSRALEAVVWGNVPTPFLLVRSKDVTGVSGEGVVAWGVVFPDGKVVTRWCGDRTSVRQTCVWDSLDHVLAVHGHGGATKAVYVEDGRAYASD